MPVSRGRTRRRYAAWASALLLASALLGDAFAGVEAIDVRRNGEVYTVHASAPVSANARIAFETLTDYERLRDFVPDVETARVVARNGNRLIVELSGSLDLFIFSLPVRARLAVEHQPYERVLARSEPGLIGSEEPTLQAFSGQYVVTALAEPGPRVRVDYDARFRLAHAFPEFIESVFGQEIVMRGLRRHFEAMLTEIERRQAMAASSEKR